MEKNLDLKYFLEIERKYNLYEDTIEGIRYWVYSRFTIWEDIIIKTQLNLGKAHSNKELRIYDKAKIFLKLIKYSLFNFNVRKKNIDLLFISHPRRVLNQGKYECIYTEELAKIFVNYAVYEQPYQWQHLEPVDTTNMIFGDKILLKKGLYLILYKTILRGQYKKLLKEIEEKITEPLNEIEEVYKFSLNRSKIADSVVTQIIFYKASVGDVEKLLSQLNPKVVIEVVGYNPFCMLVNEICKKKGITTIELQHGTMNKHMAYQYMTECDVAQFPDKMFLFSEFWKKQISVPIKDENFIVTGFPYFERKLEEAKVIQKYNDDKINILFISQGTIGSRLSELANGLSCLLDPEKYRIFYKLHPGEVAIWKKKYIGLAESNVIVISGNEYSLYDYFATCQIQVGVYSTALYEGLGFGLDTFIYKIEMAGHMQGLCESGYVKYVSNGNELSKFINEQNSSSNVQMDFWEKDSLNKMEKNIKKLL